MNKSDSLNVSFVIPARDEELLLETTLNSIRAAAAECEITYEIIVVDDASTDRTAEIAKSLGAQVVAVELHNIGAVRNAGAAAARGNVLFFLDADTQVPGHTLRAALKTLEQGAVGGGATVSFEPGLSLMQRALARIFIFLWQRVCGWAAGCNIFVRRSLFETVGGFDTHYFAAEERYLSEALKRQGKFVIIRESVITSARKLRLYSTGNLIWLAFRVLFWRQSLLTSRDALGILYDAPRETR